MSSRIRAHARCQKRRMHERRPNQQSYPDRTSGNGSTASAPVPCGNLPANANFETSFFQYIDPLVEREFLKFLYEESSNGSRFTSDYFTALVFGFTLFASILLLTIAGIRGKMTTSWILTGALAAFVSVLGICWRIGFIIVIRRRQRITGTKTSEGDSASSDKGVPGVSNGNGSESGGESATDLEHDHRPAAAADDADIFGGSDESSEARAAGFRSTMELAQRNRDAHLTRRHRSASQHTQDKRHHGTGQSYQLTHLYELDDVVVAILFTGIGCCFGAHARIEQAMCTHDDHLVFLHKGEHSEDFSDLCSRRIYGHLGALMMATLLAGKPQFRKTIIMGCIVFVSYVIMFWAVPNVPESFGDNLRGCIAQLVMIVSVCALKAFVHSFHHQAFEALVHLQVKRRALLLDRAQFHEFLERVLPPTLFRRVKNIEGTATCVNVDSSTDAVVVTASISDVTQFTARRIPRQVAQDLAEFHSAATVAAQLIGIDRIAMIGDVFIATSNLLRRARKDHHQAAMRLALQLAQWDGGDSMRVGVHAGHAVGAVIGLTNVHYCIFGEAPDVSSLIVQSDRHSGAYCTSVLLRYLSHLHASDLPNQTADVPHAATASPMRGSGTASPSVPGRCASVWYREAQFSYVPIPESAAIVLSHRSQQDSSADHCVSCDTTNTHERSVAGSGDHLAAEGQVERPDAVATVQSSHPTADCNDYGEHEEGEMMERHGVMGHNALPDAARIAEGGPLGEDARRASVMRQHQRRQPHLHHLGNHQHGGPGDAQHRFVTDLTRAAQLIMNSSVSHNTSVIGSGPSIMDSYGRDAGMSVRHFTVPFNDGASPTRNPLVLPKDADEASSQEESEGPPEHDCDMAYGDISHSAVASSCKINLKYPRFAPSVEAEFLEFCRSHNTSMIIGFFFLLGAYSLLLLLLIVSEPRRHTMSAILLATTLGICAACAFAVFFKKESGTGIWVGRAGLLLSSVLLFISVGLGRGSFISNHQFHTFAMTLHVPHYLLLMSAPMNALATLAFPAAIFAMAAIFHLPIGTDMLFMPIIGGFVLIQHRARRILERHAFIREKQGDQTLKEIEWQNRIKQGVLITTLPRFLQPTDARNIGRGTHARYTRADFDMARTSLRDMPNQKHPLVTHHRDTIVLQFFFSPHTLPKLALDPLGYCTAIARASTFVDECIADLSLRVLHVVKVYGNRMMLAGPLLLHRETRENHERLLTVATEESVRIMASLIRRSAQLMTITAVTTLDSTVSVLTSQPFPTFDMFGAAVGTGRILLNEAPPGSVIITDSTLTYNRDNFQTVIDKVGARLGKPKKWRIRGLGNVAVRDIRMGDMKALAMGPQSAIPRPLSAEDERRTSTSSVTQISQNQSMSSANSSVTGSAQQQYSSPSISPMTGDQSADISRLFAIAQGSGGSGVHDRSTPMRAVSSAIPPSRR